VVANVESAVEHAAGAVRAELRNRVQTQIEHAYRAGLVIVADTRAGIRPAH
jgi:hypothetical protein